MYTIERHGYQRTEYDQAKWARNWFRQSMQASLKQQRYDNAVDLLAMMVANAETMSELEERQWNSL